MGMTDRQFVSYRRHQLREYERMLEIAKETNADAKLIEEIEKAAEQARADIKA